MGLLLEMTLLACVKKKTFGKKKTILTFLVGCTLSINNYTYVRVYICKRSVTRKILFLVKFYKKPPLNKQSRLKFQQASESDHIKGLKKWRQNMISSFLPSVSALWIIHHTSNRFWWIIISKIPAVRFTKHCDSGRRLLDSCYDFK